jgi:hypothetical protein
MAGMKDELFSTLAWKEYYGWHVTITLANGKTATVTLDVGDEDESIPDVIRDRLRFLVANEPQITLKIASSVIELRKDWLDDDITTPEELAQKINLIDVSIYEDCDGELYYEPNGDMFGGHVITVYFDANGQLDEPDLAG